MTVASTPGMNPWSMAMPTSMPVTVFVADLVSMRLELSQPPKYRSKTSLPWRATRTLVIFTNSPAPIALTIDSRGPDDMPTSSGAASVPSTWFRQPVIIRLPPHSKHGQPCYSVTRLTPQARSARGSGRVRITFRFDPASGHNIPGKSLRNLTVNSESLRISLLGHRERGTTNDQAFEFQAPLKLRAHAIQNV